MRHGLGVRVGGVVRARRGPARAWPRARGLRPGRAPGAGAAGAAAGAGRRQPNAVAGPEEAAAAPHAEPAPVRRQPPPVVPGVGHAGQVRLSLHCKYFDLCSPRDVAPPEPRR